MLFTFDVRDCESFLSKNRSVVKLYVQILWKMSKDRINENKGRVNARVFISPSTRVYFNSNPTIKVISSI